VSSKLDDLFILFDQILRQDSGWTINIFMNITIAGFGFVGKAHKELLKDTHNITIYDPEQGYTTFGTPDGIIVCVSTPPRKDGSCDMTNVFEVIERSPDVPILIKSTISVEGWDMLVDTFPNRMLNFSPEFLRQATYLDDIKQMDKLLIGGTSCNYWARVFGITTEIADPRELILAKYARNSFLALKVAFFNQMYDLCDALDVEYSAVAHYTTMDERIGDSHSFITEERGFGGHCFPKDINAIIQTGQRDNVDLSILKEVVEYNKRIRKT
jgi:UDPglucose 6-dehydrogenase